MLKVVSTFVVMTSLGLSIAIAGSTHDPWPNLPLPTKRQWPPGPTRDYLRNLKRPDAGRYQFETTGVILCCDESETVDTKFLVEYADSKWPEDRWYAWLEGEWKKVPPERIAPDYAPDGRAYIFVSWGVINCFVRPRGGL